MRGKSYDHDDQRSRKIIEKKVKDEDKSVITNLSDSSSVVRSKILLGVCAMEKKTNSEAMRNLLKLIDLDPRIDILVFSEKTILKKEVREWRKVHALICFFSKGFPLWKAEKYADMHKVYLINNIKNQRLLWDRTKIYSLLRDYKIPLADCTFVRRFKENLHEQKTKRAKEKLRPVDLKEFDNHILHGSKKILKPFVEKPFDAENHNIRIYYPMKEGGGCKHLFRKINNISSRFNKKENKIRRDGNYIYEEFLPNDGFDIKVYAIGLNYFHAETRKSPTVDGIVMRTKAGREVRYPINLTLSEKIICRKIVMIFDQTVCGFDIIRSKGKSYVCDVNGWSFVKDNQKYTSDCAFLLRKFIYERFFPNEVRTLVRVCASSRKGPVFHKFRPFAKKVLNSNLFGQNDLLEVPSKRTQDDMLCSHKALNSMTSFRPKEGKKSDTRSRADLINELKEFDTNSIGKKQKKQKKRSRHKDSLSMNLSNSPMRHLSPVRLRNVVKVSRGSNSLFDRPNELIPQSPNEELRSVIAIFRHQDRSPKQKMKMKTHDQRFLKFFDGKKKSKEIKIKSKNKMNNILEIAREISKEIDEKLEEKKAKEDSGQKREQIQELRIYKIKILQLIAVLESHDFIRGINRKIQMKPLKVVDEAEGRQRVTKALFILKWGGSITHAGLQQAEEFGKYFRENFYVNNKEGLLRLHSTYRHDLKVYSADEGRCQLTAAAFTKGLLMIEEDLTPILTSFINSNPNSVAMLDVSKSILNKDQIIHNSFCSLQKIFTSSKPLSGQLKQISSPQFNKNVQKLKNPLKKLRKLSQMVRDFCEWVNGKLQKETTSYYLLPEDNRNLKESLFCGSENGTLLLKRWMKLGTDFHDNESDKFDTSKLPDILDSIR